MIPRTHVQTKLPDTTKRDTNAAAAAREAKIFELFAITGMSFAMISVPLFRELLKVPEGMQSREAFTRRFIAESRLRQTTAIQRFRDRKRKVTLAVDSGTVWRRYFIVVALCPQEEPLIVGMAADGELGGRQTAVALAAYLSRLMATVLRDVEVVAIVGDNASNVQAALRQVVVVGDGPRRVDVVDGGDHDIVLAEVDAPPEHDDPVANNEAWFIGLKFFRVRCLAHSWFALSST
jgi:hypothetical protein